MPAPTPVDRLVLSPQDGAVIPTATVTVRIWRTNWQELWVESSSLASTLPGTQNVRTDAYPYQGDSFAVGVPIWEGANQLVVHGRHTTGQVVTRTLQVTRAATVVDGVVVSATPTTVHSTATPIQITAGFVGIGTPVEGWIDVEGDGRLDAPFPGTLAWTYATQGYYAPRVVVRLTNGLLVDSTVHPVPLTVTGPTVLTETVGQFELPVPARDVAVDRLNRQVLVLTEDSRVHVFTEAGATVASYTLAGVQTLSAIDVDDDGNLYTVDRGLHQLRKFTRSAGFASDTTFGTNGIVGVQGSGDGQFNEPRDVQCLSTPTGAHVWAADSANGRVQCFNGSGQFELALPTGADVTRPVSVVTDFAGHLTVIDGADGDLAVFELGGTRVAYRPAAVGVDPSHPCRANADEDLSATTADPAHHALLRTNRDGAVLTTIDVAPNVPLAVVSATSGGALVAVAGATRLKRLSGTEPAGESPVEVLTRFLVAVNQNADSNARAVLAPESVAEFTALLADPVKGPAYRNYAGRVGAAVELSRSGRMAMVHAMVDPSTPQGHPITVELRRDGATGRWLVLGL